jgi:alcohol dehydrogenase YqhD (iron-dependent ADH family)
VRPAIPAALPVGVVLTIAAAGSEASTNSVVNLEPENLKRAAGGDILRPKFAVMNPELTMTLPPFQTACGLADMFAHLCERYFSPTKDVALTDNLCEAVMKTVIEESARVMADPNDYQARANIMWAGTLAHNDICGAGRVQDWASHGIEHELSALYDCAHGAGLAVVMPAWMTYVHATDDARFARFARNVFGVGIGESDADAALAGIGAFRRWLKSLGLPLTFAELGAREEDIPLLVKTLNLSGNTLGGFRPLDEADVAAIYRMCL